MVKRRTIRDKINKKESKKSTEKDACDAGDSGVPNENVSSLRLKRKVTKKMKFLSKLQETQQILGTKKVISKKTHRRKKSALNSLSSLADVLPALKEERKLDTHLTLPKRNQAKARQKLVVHEAKQLSKVMEHPEFKSNPFSAIHQHLVKTLSPQVEDLAIKLAKERSSKKSGNKRKQKQKHNDMEE